MGIKSGTFPSSNTQKIDNSTVGYRTSVTIGHMQDGKNCAVCSTDMHTRQISSRKNHCSIGDLQCISTGVSGFSMSLSPRELSPPVPVFLEVLADAAGPVGAGLVVGYERTARQSFTEHRRQHLKYQHSAVYCHRP